MKKLFKNGFLIFLILISSFNLLGQHQFEDSAQVYTYWAERGIIEAVHSYMKDYLTTVNLATNTKENTGAEKYFTNYIKNIDSKNSKEIEKDFGTINSFLKENNWADTEEKLFNRLAKNYDNKVPLKGSFFIAGTNFNNNKIWDSTIKSILSNYEANLRKLQGSKNNIIADSQSPTYSEVVASNSIYLDYILLFFGGLLIGGVLVFLYSKSKIYSILFQEKSKYLNSLNTKTNWFTRHLKIVGRLKESKDEKKEEISDLHKNIADLNKQIETFKINSEAKNRNQMTVEKLAQSNLIEKKEVNNNLYHNEEVNIKNELYFSIPFQDGSFLDEHRTINKEHNSFYKIIKRTENSGDLYFISGQYDKTAIDDINGYLSPVCNIENIGKRLGATKISLINPGKVKLLGDRWEIDNNNRVQIKLL